MTSIYLDHASTSFPKAPGVADDVFRFLNESAYNSARGAYSGALASDALLFSTRILLQEFFGASEPAHVLFQPGATAAINALLFGLLEEGDHVITSSMEHNAVMRPLRALEERGIQLSLCPVSEEGFLEVEALSYLIRENTKAIIITAASNVCGAVMPLKEIGDLCKEKGIFLLVDAAQGGGAVPIHMDECGIDGLAFAGHKSLMGPPGIGGFLISSRLAKVLRPAVFGGTGSFSHLETMPKVLPDRFEAGTLNLAGIAGLHAALLFWKREGFSAITEKKHSLLCTLKNELREIPGLRLLGPKEEDRQVGVLSADFPGTDNAEIAAKLAEKDVFTRVGLHCAPRAHRSLGSFPQGSVRFSVGYFQTQEDMIEAARRLKEIL